ncbi:HEPN domain-containing protein [Hymenobacter daecheongensis DSM 21074]|uniref:HEPN domain-containing protein n=1 Tax=Hymenobacter daecheongensis DSM 21074 TaxID=1121955 RepID=A0A1M6J788_9BACT|nr:HEPN domain-containing protein [Hymenobacter daecheongensis]SHJ42520.1 HEPN domain-containing protein [Hymenobacter daecheongensis DSM 21074]
MLLNPSKQHHIRTLFQVAERDLESTEVLLRHSPHLYEVVGFHCQQAVEKLLKAALVGAHVAFPCTHDLVRLAELLPVSLQLPDDLIDEAAGLNIFAVQHRHELEEASGLNAAALVTSSN